MLEALAAAALLGALLALPHLLTWPPEAWLWAGIALGAGGLALGVPTGVVYHVALHRGLREAGRVPAGWLWRPTALHDRLPAERRPAVAAWCAAGAIGFLTSVLGCLLVAVGLARGL